MISRIKIVVLLTLAFFSLSMIEVKKDFHVTVHQNGEEIEIVDNVVLLEKSEFEFVIEFSEPIGILVNGSFFEHTYQMALNGEEIDKLPGFTGSGMAEYKHNQDTEMFVQNDSPSYWYYSDDENSRFDKIEKKDNKIICTRTINNLFILEDRSTPSLSEVEGPLYLVFISFEQGEGFYDRIEHKREMIKIEWKD